MFEQFSPQTVRPEGWLKRQLTIQVEGLCGNLDKVWPDVQHSEWIGGTCEGWERVPYWLDGAIPLAHLLEHDDLIKRTDRYVDAILDRQRDDGWICPAMGVVDKDYDVWALFLIGKVLAQYCTFTESQRALDGLYRAMRCFYEKMRSGEIALFGWGQYRWFECMIPLQFLYDRYHEDWILRLAELLQEQGTDYAQYIETWKRPLNQWTMHTHIVNIAMMFKAEAVTCKLLGGKISNQAGRLWRILEKHNGTVVGTFTGDECLSGIGNNRGTELCSVVELMYSCEILYQITGDRTWADRLERIAFNALPATLTDDMWAHQYDQMVNQIACQILPGKSFFRTNNSEAHLFGLEPHFGCCTANFGQGWPKLAMNIFLRADDGIHCALLLPARLQTQVEGTKVCVAMETEYPFRLGCKFTVETDRPAAFQLSVRIPEWVKDYCVDGVTYPNTGIFQAKRVWEGVTELRMELHAVPRWIDRPYGLKSLQFGPLVYALPLQAEYKMREYEKNGVVRKYPYCDYELIPRSQWQYGFAETGAEVCYMEGDQTPFSSNAPRTALKVKLQPLHWEYADGYETIAAKKPTSRRAMGPEETHVLIPYGCAKLRMTEMPMVHKRNDNSVRREEKE